MQRPERIGTKMKNKFNRYKEEKDMEPGDALSHKLCFELNVMTIKHTKCSMFLTN
jgi:hypothetical protein